MLPKTLSSVGVALAAAVLVVAGCGGGVMAADGSAQVQLSGCAPGEASPCTGGDDFAPVWSPDGSRIAFLRAFGAVGANDRPVYVMDADGTDQKRLTDGTILQAAPAWQALRT